MTVPLAPEYADQIKRFEGFAPVAAWDYKQNTNGYGTKALSPGEKIDEATANERFQAAIAEAAAHVDKVNPNLPAGARAALIDLTFNAGPGWANSGLGEMVRAGDLQGAQQRLLEYNKAGGSVLPALQKRREAAAAWFNSTPPAQAPTPQPSPVTQPAPAQSPLQAAPQSAPIFAAQQAPVQPQAPDLSALMQPPAMPSAPIFAAPRRPVDLSKLQAALAASRPIFSQG